MVWTEVRNISTNNDEKYGRTYAFARLEILFITLGNFRQLAHVLDCSCTHDCFSFRSLIFMLGVTSSV